MYGTWLKCPSIALLQQMNLSSDAGRKQRQDDWGCMCMSKRWCKLNWWLKLYSVKSVKSGPWAQKHFRKSSKCKTAFCNPSRYVSVLINDSATQCVSHTQTRTKIREKHLNEDIGQRSMSWQNRRQKNATFVPPVTKSEQSLRFFCSNYTMESDSIPSKNKKKKKKDENRKHLTGRRWNVFSSCLCARFVKAII